MGKLIRIKELSVADIQLCDGLDCANYMAFRWPDVPFRFVETAPDYMQQALDNSFYSPTWTQEELDQCATYLKDCIRLGGSGEILFTFGDGGFL
jgi:hypothetical protein